MRILGWSLMLLMVLALAGAFILWDNHAARSICIWLACGGLIFGTNTLSTSITANYTGQGVTASAGAAGVQSTITSNFAPEGVLSETVTTTAAAIPLGGVATPRYLYVQNLDATNYVTIKTSTAGTNIARLLPGASGGDQMLIPLDPSITAPAWQSHTASCNVSYRIFDT